MLGRLSSYGKRLGPLLPFAVVAASHTLGGDQQTDAKKQDILALPEEDAASPEPHISLPEISFQPRKRTFVDPSFDPFDSATYSSLLTIELLSRSNISRDTLTKMTNFGNSTATEVLDASYIVSLVAGFFEANGQPDIAAYWMNYGRFGYNFQTFIRSLLRYLTTNPENRTNENAKSFAEWSNFLSALSITHAATVMAAYLPSMPMHPAARAYLLGPAFNISALFGTLAAQAYNSSEEKESTELLSRITHLLSQQTGISYNEALEIAKSTMPHITASEYDAKSWSYTLGGLAAIGGLLNIPQVVMKDHLPAHYKKLLDFVGEVGLKRIGRAGAIANGVLYAVAALFYPVMVSDNHEGPNCRLPKEKSAEWDSMRKFGILEMGLLVAGVAAAAYAMKSGRMPKLKHFEGKADCVAGAFAGGAFIFGSAIYNKRAPSLDDLRKAPDQSRSFWGGPRLQIMKDALEYLANTDPSLPEEKVHEYLRELALKINKTKNVLPEGVIESMSTKQLKELLEEGKCTKNGNTRILDSDGKPFCPGAHLAAKMRRAERLNGQPKDSFASRFERQDFYKPSRRVVE